MAAGCAGPKGRRRARPTLPDLGLLAIAITAVGAASAYQVQQVSVDRHGDRYDLHMTVELDVAASAAYAALADPMLLPRINPAVREVSVTRTGGSSSTDKRVATVIRLCVSFFCRRLRQVQDMQFAADDQAYRIHAKVLPQLSDLRHGEANWHLIPCGSRTCLSFDAQLEPDFWIPPLIGPWLVQRKLHEQAMQTSAGIERVAREQSAAAGAQ